MLVFVGIFSKDELTRSQITDFLYCCSPLGQNKASVTSSDATGNVTITAVVTWPTPKKIQRMETVIKKCLGVEPERFEKKNTQRFKNKIKTK